MSISEFYHGLKSMMNRKILDEWERLPYQKCQCARCRGESFRVFIARRRGETIFKLVCAECAKQAFLGIRQGAASKRKTAGK